MTTLTEEDLEQFREATEKYLVDLHISNWSQAYNIHDPNRRKVAVEWLTQQFVGVLAVLGADT